MRKLVHERRQHEVFECSIYPFRAAAWCWTFRVPKDLGVQEFARDSDHTVVIRLRDERYEELIVEVADPDVTVPSVESVLPQQ